MGQFLPGTDFVTSGYSVCRATTTCSAAATTTRRHRRVADAPARLAGRRRDRAADEDEALARARAGGACDPGGLRRLRLPAITRRGGRGGDVRARHRDLPDRDRAADVAAADRVLAEGISGLDVARELDRARLHRRRRGDPRHAAPARRGDYLQTSAIIDADGTVHSAVNDPNRYSGPGTGYRLDGERWQRLQQLPHELDARSLEEARTRSEPRGREACCRAGNEPDDVVIALGPAFGDGLRATISGLAHEDVLEALIEGVREGGRRAAARPRAARSDVAFIGHDGAASPGSGVAIGIQSKGTTVIHRADLAAARQPRALRHGAAR